MYIHRAVMHEECVRPIRKRNAMPLPHANQREIRTPCLTHYGTTFLRDEFLFSNSQVRIPICPYLQLHAFVYDYCEANNMPSPINNISTKLARPLKLSTISFSFFEQKFGYSKNSILVVHFCNFLRMSDISKFRVFHLDPSMIFVIFSSL